ncbi:MAG TPA: hypothetical protein GXZ47_10010 [Treponema sp.]|nr:hypothetical protein [Treponema sp.]
MTKRKILLIAGCTVLILFAFNSCKSAPKAEEVDESVHATDDQELKEIDSALISLRDKMETLREDCVKYRLGSYRPEDWQKAETARGDGLAAMARVVTEAQGDVGAFISAEDYDNAIVSFNEAIESYETVLIEGRDAFIDDVSQELIREREAAIAAGAPAFYPQQFNQARQSEQKALEALEAGDAFAAYDEAQIAIMRYKVLQRGMEAIALKKLIDDKDFEQYDSDSYALAGVKFNEAADAYGTADAGALDLANESVALYKKVKNAGYQELSRDMRAQTLEIRALCDSIKASRAMSGAYSGANGLLTKADAFGKADDWEAAYNGYSQASVAFTDVYQQVSLKKHVADTAMSAARSSQEYSSELAKKADEEAPLPEGAEGFSDDSEILKNLESNATPVESREEL